MWKSRVVALIIILLGTGIGYFDYVSQKSDKEWLSFPFRLGLDLSGGSHLVYEADTSGVSTSDIPEAMSALRGVIERRVNLFGVAEPIVQTEGAGLTGSGAKRLIVELPGVTDLDAAIKLIGRTPNLEFKSERPDGPEKEKIVAAFERAKKDIEAGLADGGAGITINTEDNPLLKEDPRYVSTGLSGRYLKKAQVVSSQNSLSPAVSLEFNKEGTELFSKITKENVGKRVAIYLDGQSISEPTVNEEIREGRAEITGQFTLEQAKQLSRDLNLGALPVPIKLVSTQTIGATLGEDVTRKGITAGMYGLAAIAIFLIVWYRLPGFLAAVALAVYTAVILAIFKLMPVTLTSAGIAGFILSIGIAVDANVLIFERMKEELRGGKDIGEAIEDGFKRAWPSIRDSNISSVITAVVLFWFGESLIEGFALTFALGVIVSMFSAIIITRVLLRAMGSADGRVNKLSKFLFSSGIN